ncbi:hypothetical protein CPC08DRAFT_709483 [Agrocybe pediades]|nr:hypothetical protein CPC08DRAFT_709483 [Agrocybe pediades]
MSAPISILHEDILWRIFMENVEFPDDLAPWGSDVIRPIVTARRCSQVCQRWRYTLLSSSSIWAKMIDLESLGQARIEWKEEVVSRAGEALIWIYGLIEWRNTSFSLPLLRTKWPRIQALSIWEYAGEIHMEERQKIWDCLKGPVPHLRRIHIELSDSRTAVPYPLFGDHAPLLRELHIISQAYKFPCPASWTRNLFAVTFSKAYMIKEVLDALKYMPQLVQLEIVMEDETFNRADASRIHLPHLKILQLDGNWHSNAVLLKSITPSQDCCLSRIPSYYGLDVESFQEYETAAMKYIVPYFSLHRPSVLNLLFRATNFVVFEDGAPTDARCFYFPISADRAAHFPYSSVILMTLIKDGSFSDLKELKLGLWYDFTWLGSPGPAIGTLLGLSSINIFSSITTLTTLDSVLEHLLREEFYSYAFLPNLTILRVIPAYLNEVQAPNSDGPAYHRFVRNRNVLGPPITVLEIHLETLHDVDYLEEHSGLFVRCFYFGRDLGEYRCGDGRPEKLRFGTMKKEGLLPT